MENMNKCGLDNMSNEEWMSTLTAEQWYDVMMWLTHEFALRWTNSRLAIIEWLDEKHLFLSDYNGEELTILAYSPPHNT